MLGYALNSKKLKDKLMDTSQLISEVNIEYARTMNRIIFDKAVQRGASNCAAALVPMDPEQFPQPPSRPVPHKVRAALRSWCLNDRSPLLAPVASLWQARIALAVGNAFQNVVECAFYFILF